MRILLLSEGSQWVAQCLDFDLAAQGSTLDEALDAFDTLLAVVGTCVETPSYYHDKARNI